MRILVLTDNYFPSRAACAVRMKVIVETLLASGHSVHVLASESSLEHCPAGYAQPEYVTFYSVVPMHKKTVISRLRNNMSIKNQSVKAAKVLNQGFDIVLCTSPPLLLANSAMKIAKNTHAKFVFDVRDIWPDVAYEMGSFSERSLYAKVFNSVANKAYRQSSLILTVSKGKAKKLQAKLAPSQSDKVMLIRNGIDLTFLDQSEDINAVSRYNLGKVPTCVYVGNIGLAQGLGSLLDIANVRKDVQFLIFGTGAEEDALRRRAAEEGLTNVRFCGVIGSQEVYSILKHATIAYVPLLNSDLRDSIPTKLFEAVGCGCPVLLVAQGESVEVLNDLGLGYSAPPEDFNSVLETFNALIEKRWSKEEKDNAKNSVRKHYSRDKSALLLVDALEKLVSDKTGATSISNNITDEAKRKSAR